MINRFTKILLVATSLAPILLTYWFVDQVNSYIESNSLGQNIVANWSKSISLLITTVGLVAICIFLIKKAKNSLEQIPISITEIKTADNESLAFILVYLLPLAGQTTDKLNLPVLIFIGVLFFFTVSSSNSYHFNPLLSFIGYHFYEVKLESGVTYILISKKNITNCRNIGSVVQLTSYMVIDK